MRLRPGAFLSRAHVSSGCRVRVELGTRAYDVHVGAGALGPVARRAAGDGGTVALLADRDVGALHGEMVQDALESAGARVLRHDLPAGEEAKSFGVVESACSALVRSGFERSDRIVALGGGACTDAAGFVAATLLRGVDWYTVPTTLLGQVDAAIGGKTAVNLAEGKNLAGAFHQPRAVAADPVFLQTLPEREFRSGMAEVVKTAWIGDPELFCELESRPPKGPSDSGLPEIVRRCVAVKADIVARDEREGGLRARLNFGHTLGHAIETESGGRWRHGEAVALGMVAAVHLSAESGRCSTELRDRLVRLLESLGLPSRDASLDPSRVTDRLDVDKKRAGGRVAWQLTEGLGLVSVASDLPDGAMVSAVDFLRR